PHVPSSLPTRRSSDLLLAGDDGVARRVVGGDSHHAPDGPAQIADLLAVELQHSGHCADAVRDRLLHEEAALADEVEGILEREGLDRKSTRLNSSHSPI